MVIATPLSAALPARPALRRPPTAAAARQCPTLSTLNYSASATNAPPAAPAMISVGLWRMPAMMTQTALPLSLAPVVEVCDGEDGEKRIGSKFGAI